MNNQENNQANLTQSIASNHDEVYVMPEKFQPKAVKSTSALMISIIVLLIVILGVGGYFVFLYVSNKKPAPVENQQENNAADNFGNDTDLTFNETATSTQDMASSSEATTTEASSSAPTSTENSIGQVLLTPAVPSPDTDNDNLTDLEENLIGSSPTNADTDNDGFRDGDELLNGYSPLVPETSARGRLENAPFIKIAKTDFTGDNFSTPIVKQWSFSTVKATKQAIITTDTGEIIKISVKDNPGSLSALDWYAKLNPQVTPMQLTQVEYGDFVGIISPDGLSAYFTNPLKNKIFSFEYIMDSGMQMRYPTLFKLIIKKMSLVSDQSLNATVTTTP